MSKNGITVVAFIVLFALPLWWAWLTLWEMIGGIH